MDAAHNTLPEAEAAQRGQNMHKQSPVSSAPVSSAQLNHEQPNKKHQGIKGVNAKESSQKGVAKEVHPAGSARDSESSHRLSFLLQAAHLVRETSPSLSRCHICPNIFCLSYCFCWIRHHVCVLVQYFFDSFYVATLRRLCNKRQMRLGREAKRLFCKSCNALWTESFSEIQARGCEAVFVQNCSRCSASFRTRCDLLNDSDAAGRNHLQ